MYTPASFAESRLDVLKLLIRDFPLGLLISSGKSGLLASPLPFLVRSNNETPMLVAHMAKANPHWRDLVDLGECLVAFQGHQNYVTPSWYVSKQMTHKVVPTWNYEMVQVKGKPRVIEDREWLRTQIGELTGQMEGKRVNPWKVTDAPADFVATQIEAIIGLEIVISEIQGKWKMSQNRSWEDAQGVIRGLSDKNDPHSNPDVAKIVKDRTAKRIP